ncbi:hypothetical protein TNCV_4127021 [Trichonephila clavipes]|uniref:Uncharacterized protein n=1 Tax=Trichonephila clavipes TaxID=2585209 RepID=A0A8X6SWQ1_TRICX|nr:hypothetical protein TNCV_4127021 [Trichonephila clavipes]
MWFVIWAFFGTLDLLIEIISNTLVINSEPKFISALRRLEGGHLYRETIKFFFTNKYYAQYAAPVWGTAAPTTLKKVQIIQNKVLKIITNASCYVFAAFVSIELSLSVTLLASLKLPSGKWHVNYGVPVPKWDVPPHQNFRIKSRISGVA